MCKESIAPSHEVGNHADTDEQQINNSPSPNSDVDGAAARVIRKYQQSLSTMTSNVGFPPTQIISNMVGRLLLLFPNLSTMPPRRRFLYIFLICSVAVSILFFAGMYTFHKGFHRTVQFWSRTAPLVVQYKFLNFKARRIDNCTEVELNKRLDEFHKHVAPRLAGTILDMGGIFVKFGQVISTVGVAILPEPYIEALRPLQDGVPPRDYKQISRIIETSTGRTMDELFLSFDELPIGAASIGQAHRATLRNGMQVIVKVQYPNVADLFETDFNNMELVTRLISPEDLSLVRALRKRHENELDFRLEAENLRQVTSNMQRYGVEPSIVRIPRVINETGLCTDMVLALEYLQGTSLAEAIKQEQDRVAKGLGMENSEELKNLLIKRMKEHMENGGGATDEGSIDFFGKQQMLLRTVGPFAARVLRFVGGAREFADEVGFRAMSLGQRFAHTVRPNKSNLPDLQNIKPHQEKRKQQKINIRRAIKTLVHVHGLQMIRDGLMNADPHPGNVLILPDGRLGLLDYGMVDRISPEDRLSIARVVHGIAENNKTEVAQVYLDAGYRMQWIEEGLVITDANILHRFASWHFDRIDLSPIVMENKKKIDIMELFQSIEKPSGCTVPLWIEQGRRLGGILIGTATQAASPVSLSREWKPIAKHVLRENRQGTK